jgi:hypothetical protein
MSAPNPTYLHALANECVDLVFRQFGRQLWWQLIGAYTGDVAIRVHGGEWVEHEGSRGAPAILALGVTGFPFGLAWRVLDGEPHNSLATFVRARPAIAENAERG